MNLVSSIYDFLAFVLVLSFWMNKSFKRFNLFFIAFVSATVVVNFFGVDLSPQFLFFVIAMAFCHFHILLFLVEHLAAATG